MISKVDYLAAMSATGVPKASSGLWFIEKLNLPKGHLVLHEGEYVDTPPGIYTYLRIVTDSTVHLRGEIVMEDTPHELRTHLGFIMRAYGRVLVTGLGLGCVIRGLLKNPAVEHVTCIENSPDVLKLIGPYMPADRLTIVQADALKWTAQNTERFDCAWHDLWTNRDKGEPHLDLWHQQLIFNCRDKVAQQGAWGFDRNIKALIVRRNVVQWIG